MADNNPKRKSDLLATARKRFDACVSAHSTNRSLQIEDWRFYAASPDNGWQWPQQVKVARESDPSGPRPCLTINKLPQHVHQVTNEMRQNMPAIKVLPVDGESDPEVATVLNGIIKHIEYHSDAETAYDMAGESQVICGEGYFRVLTEYCDERTFDQDIVIKPIRNHESAYLEPFCDACGVDAKYGFIVEDYKEDRFEEEFPDAKKIDWSEASTPDYSNWFITGEKVVRVAEYFYIETEERELWMLPDGQMFFKDELPKDLGMKPLKTRRVLAERVKWCKLNGAEILQEQNWAGRYIPILRVIGNEVEINGEIYYYGLVRPAKDAQRMYNYWTSQEAEVLALAPKMPYVGAAGQFEGYEKKWEKANVQNYAYLEYNPVLEGGSLVPPPQRVQPAMIPAGILQAKLGAAEDIKGTTAQYDASLGNKSNETSGRAIMARQKEGDVANFHYTDNFARTKRFLGKLLIDLIPKIYDSKRIARIVKEGGDTDQVVIDPEQAQAVMQIAADDGTEVGKSYNLSVGRYDVMVTVGPSYTTKRQENAEMMAKILQTTPQLWPIAGDLMVREMDWPGAEKFAERLKKMLPPQLRDPEDGRKPLPPEAQAAVQQAQMAMQAVQQKAAELQEVENQLKGESAKTIAQKAALEEERTRLAAEKQVLDARYNQLVAQLEAKVSQAACKEAQDEASKAQETLDRVGTPAPEGGQEYLQAAEMNAQMVTLLTQILKQTAAPKRKDITENPDGSFTMLEVPTIQ